MEKSNQLQLQTNNSSEIAQTSTAQAIAAIRLDVVNYPRYGSISQGLRLEWLAKEIKVLASIVRIKDIDGREAVFMASTLDDMLSINGTMSDLTLPELHESFMHGVFGEYGNFHGLSAPNLYGFIKSYLGSDKKMESVKIVRKANEKQRRAEREAEERQIRQEIENAKRNGTYVPGELFGNGRITLDGVFMSVSDIAAESAEKDVAHRDKVIQQAKDILSKAGKI